MMIQTLKMIWRYRESCTWRFGWDSLVCWCQRQAWIGRVGEEYAVAHWDQRPH
jgi:hypothetical protein